MPVYEFYCPSCNTIFSFFSRSVNTEKIPPCPRDPHHGLRRRVSLFAAVSASKVRESKSGHDNDNIGGEKDDPLGRLGIDEARMEKAVEALVGETEGIDENDPRAAARLMRKFSNMTGLRFKGKFEEAISRMEAGEDPETLEEEMGDSLESEDPFDMIEVDNPAAGAARSKARPKPPLRDETLYDM